MKAVALACLIAVAAASPTCHKVGGKWTVEYSTTNQAHNTFHCRVHKDNPTRTEQCACSNPHPHEPTANGCKTWDVGLGNVKYISGQCDGDNWPCYLHFPTGCHSTGQLSGFQNMEVNLYKLGVTTRAQCAAKANEYAQKCERDDVFGTYASTVYHSQKLCKFVLKNGAICRHQPGSYMNGASTVIKEVPAEFKGSATDATAYCLTDGKTVTLAQCSDTNVLLSAADVDASCVGCN